MSGRPPAPGAAAGAGDVVTLIDEFLAGQRRLTAVEKFSQFHDRQEGHLLASHYRDLVPLAAPRPGEQYAFEVDLDRCSGCKGCVSACHSLNGLDEDETWRQVGLLVGEAPLPVPGREAGQGAAVRPSMVAWQQTVTTACHHCVEPGCLSGCPVLAYDKDPVTGIVRHLDDQCIGCSYCILMCPYEVPKYSARQGIVRKCDLCHGRLAVGEAPACVQACPNEAIRISVVRQDWFRIEFRRPAGAGAGAGAGADAPAAPRWLPDAPDPSLTLPTTRYLTRHDNAGLRAADHDVLSPQPAHWPLVWMLVFTQMGVGAWALVPVVRWLGQAPVADALQVTAWLAAHLGLFASVFHLGQPWRAWRAFLGWRTSWMSREILAFGLFSALATGAVVTGGAGIGPFRLPAGPAALMQAAAGVAGLGAVFTSAMIYVAARRPLWTPGATVGRFFGTAGLLGASLGGTVVAWGQRAGGEGAGLAVGLAWTALVLRVGLFGWGEAALRSAVGDSGHPAHRSARLARRHFAGVIRARRVLFLASTGLGGLAILRVAGAEPFWATGSLLCTVAGVVLERWMFFSTCVSPRMPGLP